MECIEISKMAARGIESIIFDLGGVILNLDNQKTEQAFEALGVGDLHHHFRIGFAASFFKDYEVGKISDSEFISCLREMVPQSASDELLKDAWNALLIDFPPARLKLLGALKKSFRLFLLSNTNALHLEAFAHIYRRQFGQGSLEDHFEKTYYSHLLGLRKPEPAIYHLVLRENRLDPSKTLFVDDAEINIRGAQQAGLEGLHLAPGLDITQINWDQFK